MIDMLTRAACAHLALLMGAAVAQVPDPDAAPDPRDAVKEMMRTFEENGIAVDLEAKSITISAEIVLAADPLEFLLIGPKGKGHEALFVTGCKASVLNAAFLLIGYRKGANMRLVDRDPPPTEEEMAQGAPMFDVVPPEGELVWFTVRWQRIDDDGQEEMVEAPVEDLILDMTTDRAVEGADWVYLGGQMAAIYRNEDPVFVADFEGNHVSVVYKQPPNHLITMRHALAADDMVWWRTDLTPEAGTSVELIAHREKTEFHVARERRLAAERDTRGDGEEPAQPDDDPSPDRDEPR